MIFSVPLHHLVTCKVQVSHTHAVRSSLRAHFSTRMGFRPNQTSEQYVFFRQNVQSTTCAQAYSEWCDLSQQELQSLLHLVVKVHPTVVVNQTDWYSIIRYCLKSIGTPATSSVVFTPPALGKTLDLFVLKPSDAYTTDIQADERQLIHQMMALQIALYLERPLYCRDSTLSKPASDWQLEYYVNQAVYQALAYGRVQTPQELVWLLANRYQIRAQAKAFSDRCVGLRLQYQTGGWFSLNESGLPVRAINQWLIFNRRLAHLPFTKTVMNGPGIALEYRMVHRMKNIF